MTEGLYKLPSGWHWVRLGDIFELQQGASMSPRRRRGTNPKPFLRTVNIRWGIVDLSHVDEMDFTVDEAQKLSLKPGDLLICEGGDVGRTALWQGEIETCLYQNHIHRLRRRDDSILPKFYAYWMQAAYQVFVAYSGQESRTAIPNLSGRRLKEFAAPLPPFDEQCSIVAKVEALMERVREAKRLRTEAYQQTDQLLESALLEAFEERNGWDVYRLGDLIQIEARSVNPTLLDYRNLPHIGGDKITPVTGKLKDHSPAEEDGVISIKYLFSPGEVLYSKIRPYLRKAALVNFSGLCSADIYPLKVVRDDQLLPEFLRWTLVSKPFTEYAVGLSGRARMPKLNRKQIFDCHFHLPNLSEQRRMVGYLDNVQQQVNAIKRVQRDTEMEIQRLEQAILDRAFRGEL